MTRPLHVFVAVLVLAFTLSCSEDPPTGSSGSSFQLSVNVVDNVGQPVDGIRISAHGDIADVSLGSSPALPDERPVGRPHTANANEEVLPGDLNCDGTAATIADITMLRDYFFNGLAAFKDWRICAVPNGDPDHDGHIWTISDLQYMYLLWCDEVNMYSGPEPVVLGYQLESGELSVDFISSGSPVSLQNELGAIYVEVDGLIHPICREPLAQMVFMRSDGTTKIMITQGDSGLDSFRGNLLAGIDGPILKMEAASVGAARVIFKQIPSGLALHKNYPNPFSGLTSIAFDVPEYTEWGVRIYDLDDTLVDEVRGEGPAGSFQIEWSADGVNPGVYRYELVEYVGGSATSGASGYCDYLELNPDLSVLGFTNAQGRFITRDHLRFPGVCSIPTLTRTDEAGTQIGEYSYTRNVVFTLTDTVSGASAAYVRTLNPTANSITLVWAR